VTGDQRITAAREFLAAARKHKVTELPPSLLVRENAELRRQLGQVLDIIAEASEVVSQVLADAAAYREQRAVGSPCEVCDTDPEDLCGEHEADLDLAGAYTELATELGIGEVTS
jgi:hypothetical protein